MNGRTSNGFARVIVALFILGSVAGTAEAQVARGGIRGAVLDQSGAAISWAVVRVEDTVSGRAYATVASKAGEYWLRNLPAGSYVVTASSPGFRVLQVPAGAIHEGATGVLPLRLSRTGASALVAAIASDATPRTAQAAAANESAATEEEFSGDVLAGLLTGPVESLYILCD